MECKARREAQALQGALVLLDNRVLTVKLVGLAPQVRTEILVKLVLQGLQGKWGHQEHQGLLVQQAQQD